MGIPPLRQEISNRLTSHGISVIPEEILITHGSQNGLELVLKLFAGTGKKVVIESPTYAILLPLLKYYGFDTIAIPMTHGGVDLNAIKVAFQKNDCAFFYTMPNFHNPTGITTTQNHREKLLSICEHFKVPIVEDGFEEEMKYFGKVPPPIKSMDKNQIVIYLGTFSKVLFPGIRIGWIAAEKECIQRLVAIKRFSSLTSSPLLQSAISEFLKQGYYARHIQKMNRIFKKRMQITLETLNESVSTADILWTRPTGGYLIWMELNNISITEEQFLSLLNRYKIWVSLGTSYFTSRPAGISFRLSISTISEPEIIEGIHRLGALLKEAYRDFQ
jgi:DNA-binding transcriptional MocR family regulator